MRRFFTVFFLVVILKVGAQISVPKLINYKPVARDAAGIPIITAFDIIKDLSQIVHNETNIVITR